MAWNKISNLAALSLAFIFAACGDDSGNNVSSQKDSEDLSKREVSSFYELGVCDETNALTSTFVSNENAFYFCDGTGWQKTYFESYSSSNQISQIDDLDYYDLSSQFEKNSSAVEYSLSSVTSTKSSSSKFLKSSSSVRSSSSAKSSSSAAEQQGNGSICGDLICNAGFFFNSYDFYEDENTCDEKTVITTFEDDNGKLKVGVSFGYPKEGVTSYAGIHFYYVNGDISGWGGICLVYQSTLNFGIELAVKNEEVVTGYDNYKAVVKSSPTMVAVDFPWSSFKQEGWGVRVGQEFALANIEDIRLKFEGAYTDGTYIIQSMGRMGTCKSGGGPKSSSSVKSSSSSVARSSSSSAKSSSSQKIESSSSVGSEFVDGILTDLRDGQKYKTVKIGWQTWMAQNLNYESENSYCYDDDSSNCNKYGRLYTWAAAVGKLEDECGYGYTCSLPGEEHIQGVCPSGWHLPNKDEWDYLFTAVGGKSTAGKALKSDSRTGWYVSGSYGTDSSGFSALPAGERNDDDEDYSSEGQSASFWSSTEDTRYIAYHMGLSYSTYQGFLVQYSKSYGLSVRCLLD